jgi:hypothetical protein
MAHIVIQDLPDSVELDQKAMASVIGGSRMGRALGACSSRLLERPASAFLRNIPGHERLGRGASR